MAGTVLVILNVLFANAGGRTEEEVEQFLTRLS